MIIKGTFGPVFVLAATRIAMTKASVVTTNMITMIDTMINNGRSNKAKACLHPILINVNVRTISCFIVVVTSG